MPNVRTHDLNKGINDARTLIKSIRETTVAAGGFEITFTDEQSKSERRLVTDLHKSVKGKGPEVWSRKAIDRIYSDTLRDSLIPHRLDPDFETNLETELQKLKDALSAPLKERTFYYVVFGLDVGVRKRTIGNIVFFNANRNNLETLLKKMREITDAGLDSPEQKLEYKKTVKKHIYENFDGRAVAMVSNCSGDTEAGRVIALGELQAILDILNFYSTCLYPEDMKVRVFLPSDGGGFRGLNFSFQGDERFNLQFEWFGHLSNFELSELYQQHSSKLGFAKVRRILAKPSPNELEKVILNAIRIAGKSISNSRREDVFLLNAIALESLLVGGNETKDTTYKLSTRCAVLLANDLETRKKIQKHAAGLYGTRSRIAHRGDTMISDEELFRIKAYTREVLVRAVNKREFRNLTKKTDLQDWFDDRMLK